MASPQESYVQNRNPSQSNPSQSPTLGQAYLDQAYERARARLTGEYPPTEPIPAPICDAADTAKRTADQLLNGAELLRVIREPVEWILALAHQLANGDPIDVAAIVRLRAAFHARLAGRSTGIRKTDLLVVVGLLVSALDPSVVVRAVSDTIGDGLAAVFGSESPLALHITDIVDPLTSLAELLETLPPQRARGPRCERRVRSHLVR
jgi:hypothetical protein